MPKKLLTVDDSKTIRMIVARAFKPYDLEILEAANGLEGMDVAAREKPDIIILDITMPVMDGYEMLSKLRESPELKGIPVIMLTAEAGKENVLRIAKLGVRDYLVKPFKEDLVVERVGRVIELKHKPLASSRKKASTDPLKILVVEDKPAIVDQIRGAIAQTPWKVEAVDQPDRKSVV
jgi:two-component system cell cycle response regulator